MPPYQRWTKRKVSLKFLQRLDTNFRCLRGFRLVICKYILICYTCIPLLFKDSSFLQTQLERNIQRVGCWSLSEGYQLEADVFTLHARYTQVLSLHALGDDLSLERLKTYIYPLQRMCSTQVERKCLVWNFPLTRACQSCVSVE